MEEAEDFFFFFITTDSAGDAKFLKYILQYHRTSWKKERKREREKERERERQYIGFLSVSKSEDSISLVLSQLDMEAINKKKYKNCVELRAKKAETLDKNQT